MQDGDVLEYRAADQTIHPAPQDSALNPASVALLGITVSDSATQPEMQTLADRLDAMLTRQQAM